MGTADIHLKPQAKLDFEDTASLNCGASNSDHTCKLYIVVQDNTNPPQFSDPKEILVRILDQNDAPCASSHMSPNCPTIDITIDENTPLNTVVGTVTTWIDDDQDGSIYQNMKDTTSTFVIMESQGISFSSSNVLVSDGIQLDKHNTDGSFNLVIKGNINFEDLNTDTLQGNIQWLVKASDATASATGTIVVTVRDVNEPPTLDIPVGEKIQAQEVDILSDPRIIQGGKILCDALSDSFVWSGGKCQASDESATIVDITVNDVDDSHVDVRIQSIVGVDVDGVRTQFPTQTTQVQKFFFNSFLMLHLFFFFFQKSILYFIYIFFFF